MWFLWLKKCLILAVHSQRGHAALGNYNVSSSNSISAIPNDIQNSINILSIIDCVHLKPLSHQTALPQRLYSVLRPCQRAVGSPRDRRGIHVKISNLSVIACTQRPHSVPTASTRRSHSVFTASMTFSQRASSCCSVFTARTQRSHGAHTASSRRL